MDKIDKFEDSDEAYKRRVRRGEIQKLILESVKVAGLLSIALVAPNVIGAMHKLGIISIGRQSEVVSSSTSKLAKRGLLKFNGKYYVLTSRGEKELNKFKLRDYKIARPKKWDKKWRVVIFDIPEKKRKIRTIIRVLLGSMGFYRLQDSVWVYPYECEDMIGLIKTNYSVGKDVLYLIVDKIENDRYLREEFEILD